MKFKPRRTPFYLLAGIFGLALSGCSATLAPSSADLAPEIIALKATTDEEGKTTYTVTSRTGRPPPSPSKTALTGTRGRRGMESPRSRKPRPKGSSTPTPSPSPTGRPRLLPSPMERLVLSLLRPPSRSVSTSMAG